MTLTRITMFSGFCAAMIFAKTAYPCSVVQIGAGPDIVRDAAAIVRATAVEYAVPPGDPSIVTTGVPDSRIRFQVVETIRGTAIASVTLPGYLVEQDDFNDRQPPYTFVRPNGRRGSCYANSYRRGAQFLLFLQKDKSGDFTVNWSALSPVNEQLHSPDDPWLLWVREQARKIEKAPAKPK
ncbi:MAG TPA: hypothetical protein VKU19_29520 [Bryobacteraceae bacterium]|nr:hypothetical protein [Bryobacteraceae bacterium]